MAGAGYKLFNTGDVLTAAQVNTYLMEQTVMVFADAAARTTALSGVVSEGMISYLKDTNAVEVYNGSAWVASDDPNAIQNTIVDAKGDLIAASANDTPARLAVGNNGETLVADSSATVGLRYQEPKAGNPVINSSFQIWQRSTSAAMGGAGAYTSADRWATYAAFNNATMSRQVTNDTTNLPNIQYCARIQRGNGETTTGLSTIGQSFETVNSIPFAGKTVTVSFYARKGANYSATSDALVVNVKTGTGTDQNLVSVGYTGSATPITGTATLTTTWQRFSYSGTLATNTNELGIEFRFTATGTAGAADYYEVTGVQLEVGSVATPFKTQGVTLAGELSACQRYYNRVTSAGGDAFTHFLSGIFASTTQFRGIYNYPVQMRVAPTAIDYAGNFYAQDFITGYGGTVLTLQGAGIASTGINLALTGATAGRPGILFANNSTGVYFGLSAEL